jgi:hypothetical protein
MLLPGALPQRLFLRVFSFIATNGSSLFSVECRPPLGCQNFLEMSPS